MCTNEHLPNGRLILCCPTKGRKKRHVMTSTANTGTDQLTDYYCVTYSETDTIRQTENEIWSRM